MDNALEIDPNTGRPVTGYRAFQIRRPAISSSYKTLINDTLTPDFHSHPAKYGSTYHPNFAGSRTNIVSGDAGAIMSVLGAYNINILSVTYRPTEIPRLIATQSIAERREFLERRRALQSKLDALNEAISSLPDWDKETPEIKERQALLGSEEYKTLFHDDPLNPLGFPFNDAEQPYVVNIAIEFKAKIPANNNAYTSRWIKHVLSIEESDYLYHEEEWVGDLIDQVLNARERLQCPYFWEGLTDFERGE